MILGDAAARSGPGAMRAERWQALIDQLVEIDALKAGTVKAEDAYTLKYLPSPAKKAKTKDTATP
jgi:hypothetical protein